MIKMLAGVCLGLLVALGIANGPASAADPEKETVPETPKIGTAERKGIMDALRVPVMRELKQRVVFKPSHLKLAGGWAFIVARPLQPNGRKVDYSRGIHAEAAKSGALEDQVVGLLKRGKGGWTVVAHTVGATDVPYVDWPQRFGAPKSIFP